jgi:conserved oligomeric Golgi complex subunit 6
LEVQYENILRDSGLHDAVRACEQTPPDASGPLTNFTLTLNRFAFLQEPLAHVTACDPSTLRNALSSFARWLASLDAVHAPRLTALTASTLHVRIHHTAQKRLGHAYAALCARVREPRSRYEAATTLLGAERPFGSVAALWQIFGIDEDAQGEDQDEDTKSI